MAPSQRSRSTAKVARIFCLMALLLEPCLTMTLAQTADHPSQVKRLAMDWAGTEKASVAVRDRLEQKLRNSGKIEIVNGKTQADGVLHGLAVMWTAGHISTNPRSRNVQEATYRGYASAELNGKNGKTLWSYLVTPRHTGWKNIADDLADQLAAELLEAVGRKDVEEKGSATVPAGASASASAVTLHGAGATFPAPVYQKWFESFERVRPDIEIHYEAVGSEEGIRRIRARELDFGASDMPLGTAQLEDKSGKLRQIATLLGAVVPIYNVKDAPDGLNVTPEVLAGIFLGKIRSWNAAEIRAINKHVRLPAESIVVVHRSDGSGTTYAWTDYLSKASEEWNTRVGRGTTVSWPVGVGAPGNAGVAETVYKTPNSIGYVEFIYALQHELSFGAVRNSSGDYVKADLDSVTAAGKTAVTSGGSPFRTSITNAGGKHTYPIATFTWILIPEDNGDAKKQDALKDLVRWMLTSGQKQCESLGYAALPGDLAARQLQTFEAK